ncbi:hypothetical protein Y032_0001g209 [Ancylostoma ceylanicum]|uniref:Uncharacterized protein n=1 Tax=Ancylostoma ceylanicum TaxID=53326 RepID=A0A016W3A8_9BILA|nr:hypothetical protein Y032_0001g209 [Ancylostoma ceylanicum]
MDFCSQTLGYHYAVHRSSSSILQHPSRIVRWLSREHARQKSIKDAKSDKHTVHSPHIVIIHCSYVR